MTKKEFQRRLTIGNGKELTVVQKMEVLKELVGFSRYDAKKFTNCKNVEYIDEAYRALRSSFISGSNKNIFGLFEKVVAKM